MAVWKRYKQRKVVRGSKDYDKGTWIAEGRVDGVPYKKALSRDEVKTAEQARAADGIIRNQIRNDEFIFAKDKTSFSDYADTYLQFVARKNQRYEIEQLRAFFKTLPLRSITPTKCEEFKLWRSQQYARCQKCENNIEHQCSPQLISHSTVNVELSTLTSIFESARRDRKIKDNPMEFVARMDYDYKRERYLSEDEKERLLTAVAKKPQLHSIVLIGLLTGWRKNQILHLRVSDLDYDNRKVWLIAQKRKPRRSVPVGEATWSILDLLASVREDWLFINPSGRRLVEFNPAWWAALEEAQIHDFRFHDLRHTFATYMDDTGASPFAIQYALNHSRIQTTSGYTHTEEALRRGLAALERRVIPSPSAILTPSTEIIQ